MMIELGGILSDSDLHTALTAESDTLQCFIVVEGKDYHASFPASFAEALVEIQRNFYKTAAYALYGKDDIRKLTKRELKNYELVFVVRQGSTDVIIKFLEAVAELAEKVMKDMTAKEKAAFILKLTAVLCFFGGAVWAYDSYREAATVVAVEQEETKQIVEQEKTKQVAEQEETKRIQAALAKERGVLPTPAEVLSHARTMSEENKSAILKGVRNADSVRIGDRLYRSEQIQELTQRAERGSMRAEISTGIYTIVVSNFRDSEIIRLTLADEKGNELSAALDTDETDADTMDLIWQAIKGRKPLKMSINKTFVGDTLKDAYIKQVTPVNF
ncbi:hypothetical protein V9W64_10765 [Neisseria leonii]|uniref:Uncharacterized protein n=1 Tax=Neisseria leonii TaxID=2995413 RepID=A0A9X4E787_9NEIS|nr:hypothetical protein [Neisseria sp. 51.81]MDD9326723.1 hypothetical protein [Neisseria sp. 51.81]